MAITQGLWNIGGVNIPDFGISEALGIGPINAEQSKSQMSQWETVQNPSLQQPIPAGIPVSPYYSGPVYQGPANKPVLSSNLPQTKTPQPSQFSGGGVDKGNLMSRFPGYSGWNLDSAWADYLATGGSGKGGSQGGGFTSPEGQSFGSQEEYNRLIEESYNPQISALNEQERNLGLGQESALQQAQKAFETQKGMAEGQLQAAKAQLGEVATKGQSAYESALAQARQVYDQLQRGYNQRFGGSTSAGAAATEIGNVERLKQQGQSYKQLQDVNRQVEMGRMDVQKQFDNNLLQLEQNKQQAISAVQQDFRDKLAQINASRGMVESAKAQAKLQALQQLRAQVLQVQQQETSFKQQLEMQKQQAQIQLDTYAKQLQLSKGGAIDNANTNINNLGTQIIPQATIRQVPASGTAEGYQYTPTGITTNTGKNWWERLTQ